MTRFLKYRDAKDILLMLGVVGYLLLVFGYTLVHYTAHADPGSLAAYLKEVGKMGEHDMGRLHMLYVISIFFCGLPYALFPAGFWIVNGNFAPFFFFLVSALMSSWLRKQLMHGLSLWFVIVMQIVAGFPLIAYLLQSLPNHYEIPMYLFASIMAMFTYHFLIIVLVGMWAQNLAKGILGFLGIKVDA